MRVLWLCNFMLPVVAEHLGKEATNKEGWLSGLAAQVLERAGENDITLAAAFPVGEDLLENKEDIFEKTISAHEGTLCCYGFYENTDRPEQYDEALETRLKKITDRFQPDVVHCFGTEYPHTLAMCRSFPRKDRLLVGIQGLVSVYANAYFASLPKETVHSVTLRDFLKKDSLVRQQQKFEKRGRMETEAVRLAGNVTGRTAWDRFYTEKWNPKAVYHMMNETLRPAFYTDIWQEERCVPHSIFLSQGDYPIKGLHYVLEALPAILEKYPDATVSVAGNSLVRYETFKDKLKISAYGVYLRKMIADRHLEGKITFLGRLNGEAMKEQYLKSHLFLCCSSIENSPNSLGEAMLLGMPCVSADVGGIPTIFTDGRDGILYQGFQSEKNEFDSRYSPVKTEENTLENISRRLSDAVIAMWSDHDKRKEYCKNAREHAKKTHDGAENYRRMTEIYAEICFCV